MVRPAPHSARAQDPRGNGRSDRPTDPAAYADDEFIADAIAVLDANDVTQAVVVALCQGAGVSLVLAATPSGRVVAVVAINPALNLAPPHAHRAPGGFDNEPVGDTGWELENRHHWLHDWDRYTEFFFDEILPEAHSTKQHEDCVGWAAATTAETLIAYREQPWRPHHRSPTPPRTSAVECAARCW